jgi:pyruvate formate lyase activating enzyme
MVSNGYINLQPLKDALKVIDAANIDVKAFNEQFYKDIAGAKLKPVFDAPKLMKSKLWLELTNLIILGKNDNVKEIEKMCKWLAEKLGKDTPMQFSMFFPRYKMMDIEPTPEKTVANAKNISEKYLGYVYVGNVGRPAYCPKCSNLLI